MSTLRRPRSRNGHNNTAKRCLSLSKRTIDGLDQIRAKFHSRWPASSYPTLSYTLEIVLAKHLQLFERKPAELEKALKEYALKYPKGTRPYNEEFPS